MIDRYGTLVIPANPRPLDPKEWSKESWEEFVGLAEKPRSQTNSPATSTALVETK